MIFFGIIKKNNRWLLLPFTAVAAFCCLLAVLFTRWELAVCWNSKDEVHEDKYYASLSERSFSLYETSASLKEMRDEAVKPRWTNYVESPLWQGTKLIFTTDKDKKVQDFLWTDLDDDGYSDLILLLWKKGRYGKARPFWIKDDEKSYSQHIFIYTFNPEGKVKEKWCASDVGPEIRRMKLNDDNPRILMTQRADGGTDMWTWQSFGLKKIDSEISFAVFGDNLIHESIYKYAEQRQGGSFDFLYEPFLKDIQSADIAAFQQETMLVDKMGAVAGYPSFGSPLAVGEAIANAGFDIASCAGNHALDRGIYGIDVTTSFYKDKGILCLGIQDSSETEYRPFEIIKKKGISFALLDYTYGSNEKLPGDKYPYALHYLPGGNAEVSGASANGALQKNEIAQETEELQNDIISAAKEADFVIVFVHWGIEYQKEPSAEQRRLAQVMADAGADVILGTHPHVLQPAKIIKSNGGKDCLVYYSLGNFVSAPGKTEDTRTGGEAVFTVSNGYNGPELTSWKLNKISGVFSY